MIAGRGSGPVPAWARVAAHGLATLAGGRVRLGVPLQQADGLEEIESFRVRRKAARLQQVAFWPGLGGHCLRILSPGLMRAVIMLNELMEQYMLKNDSKTLAKR